MAIGQGSQGDPRGVQAADSPHGQIEVRASRPGGDIASGIGPSRRIADRGAIESGLTVDTVAHPRDLQTVTWPAGQNRGSQCAGQVRSTDGEVHAFQLDEDVPITEARRFRRRAGFDRLEPQPALEDPAIDLNPLRDRGTGHAQERPILRRDCQHSCHEQARKLHHPTPVGTPRPCTSTRRDAGSASPGAFSHLRAWTSRLVMKSAAVVPAGRAAAMRA